MYVVVNYKIAVLLIDYKSYNYKVNSHVFSQRNAISCRYLVMAGVYCTQITDTCTIIMYCKFAEKKFPHIRNLF